MNETEQLFTAILYFAVGYLIGWLTTNFSQLWEKLGPLFFILLIVPLVMTLAMAAEYVALYKNLAFSLAFAAGFLIRLIQRDR